MLLCEFSCNVDSMCLFCSSPKSEGKGETHKAAFIYMNTDLHAVT